MSWTSQGYYSDYDPIKKVSLPPAWVVYTNGVEDEEIEAYEGKTVDLKGWESRTKIIYGTSNGKFFKGYIETSDQQIVKSTLQSFVGFPIYKNKFGGRKDFNPDNLNFFIYPDLTLFVESTPLTNTELAELMQDLRDWILPKDIPDSLRVKIEQDLREKHMVFTIPSQDSNLSEFHS